MKHGLMLRRADCGSRRIAALMCVGQIAKCMFGAVQGDFDPRHSAIGDHGGLQQSPARGYDGRRQTQGRWLFFD
eukprot:9904003-Alexandrium_andersonii.AAC.1